MTPAPPSLTCSCRAAAFAALALVSCDREPAAPSCEGREPLPEIALTFEGRRPSNLLMISLDTLRRDRVGRYDGSERTPALDAILEGAWVLDDHRSCSNWTYPAMLCALTGQDTLTLGFMPIDNLNDPVPIPEDVTLLAQRLQAAGFQTAGVSANPVFSSLFDMDRGYDSFKIKTSAVAEEVTGWGLEQVEALVAGDAPWFLHLHYLDPHVPYDPPESYLDEVAALEPYGADLSRKKDVTAQFESWEDLGAEQQALLLAHVNARYDAEVRYLDDQLQRLWNGLKARGALSDTLVVVFSDHGEQLWDHGALYHHEDLYSEETAAIAAFRAPGLAAGAWASPTNHTDLAPAILDALGVEAALPEIERCARFSSALSEGGGQQSVDSEGWRLVYDWDGTLELFDRAADPSESDDLYTPDHPEAARLWSILEARVEALDAYHPNASPKAP